MTAPLALEDHPELLKLRSTIAKSSARLEEVDAAIGNAESRLTTLRGQADDVGALVLVGRKTPKDASSAKTAVTELEESYQRLRGERMVLVDELRVAHVALDQVEVEAVRELHQSIVSGIRETLAKLASKLPEVAELNRQLDELFAAGRRLAPANGDGSELRARSGVPVECAFNHSLAFYRPTTGKAIAEWTLWQGEALAHEARISERCLREADEKVAVA